MLVKNGISRQLNFGEEEKKEWIRIKDSALRDDDGRRKERVNKKKRKFI